MSPDRRRSWISLAGSLLLTAVAGWVLFDALRDGSDTGRIVLAACGLAAFLAVDLLAVRRLRRERAAEG